MPSPVQKTNYVVEGLARLTSEYQKPRPVPAASDILTEDANVLLTEGADDLTTET